MIFLFASYRQSDNRQAPPDLVFVMAKIPPRRMYKLCKHSNNFTMLQVWLFLVFLLFKYEHLM